MWWLYFHYWYLLILKLIKVLKCLQTNFRYLCSAHRKISPFILETWWITFEWFLLTQKKSIPKSLPACNMFLYVLFPLPKHLQWRKILWLLILFLSIFFSDNIEINGREQKRTFKVVIWYSTIYCGSYECLWKYKIKQYLTQNLKDKLIVTME